jgi:hypothetical protein
MRVEIHKHGFSLIGITGLITSQSRDGLQRYINTLGRVCPGVFYFFLFIIIRALDAGLINLSSFMGHYQAFLRNERMNDLKKGGKNRLLIERTSSLWLDTG